MLHVEDNTFKKSELDYVEIFANKLDYDFIYVSIGSKIYGEHDSNAFYQMFPGFLKDKKTLIIIIDDFDEINISDDEPNAIAILSYKRENDANIYIINQLFAIEETSGRYTFKNLYETLITYLEHIDPQKYIIASYIRFRLELNVKSEEHIFYMAYIKDLMSFFTDYAKKYNKYSRNFYIWTGYNLLYLKNCIYSLQFLIDNPHFEITYKFHKDLKGGFLQSIIFRIFKKNLSTNFISINELYEALKKINTNISSSRIKKENINIANLFINFCKNAIDITCENVKKEQNLYLMSDDVLLLAEEPNSVLQGGRWKGHSMIRKHRKYKIKTIRKLFKKK
jgi:hypothetical protein